jgi:hypothetical protein
VDQAEEPVIGRGVLRCDYADPKIAKLVVHIPGQDRGAENGLPAGEGDADD